MSDEAWKTLRTNVRRLVRRWGNETRQVEWDRNPIAPMPLTLAQARANLPGVQAFDVPRASAPGQRSETAWVTAFVGDGSFVYAFDSSGRTITVHWDPVADSSAYVFRYRYECARGAGDKPFYVDDGG